MWAKFGIAVIVVGTALSAVAYADNKGHGGGHGGGAHFGGHGGGGHASHASHAAHEGHEGHGGGAHGGGGHGGDAHGHGGHGGGGHAAGALRYPLYWLSWPFAYYATPDLVETCGEDSGDIAGVPIEQYGQAIQPPTDAQHAALDDLASAAAKAAQDIKAACPADLALTAPGRLAAMQQRIEAMIAAVDTVQPALEKFYSLLNDEQKARVNTLGSPNPTAEEAAGALAQNCGATQLGGMGLPNPEIDRAVHPTDAQRASLVALQNATTQAAADLLKASCVADNPLTPPARLAAVRKRLDSMLQAVKTVSSALNDFYGTLSDEQKARFEAIGPLLTSPAEPEEVSHTPVRRYGPPAIGQIIRRFVPF